MTGSNDSVTTDATTTQAGEPKLVKGDYAKAMLRAWLLQNSFNYSNYQGNGYSYLIYPALRKIHGDDRETLCKDLEQNCEFFNTNPNLIPFVTSLHLAMADQGVPYSEIRGLKMALMGPLPASVTRSPSSASRRSTRRCSRRLPRRAWRSRRWASGSPSTPRCWP